MFPCAKATVPRWLQGMVKFNDFLASEQGFRSAVDSVQQSAWTQPLVGAKNLFWIREGVLVCVFSLIVVMLRRQLHAWFKPIESLREATANYSQGMLEHSLEPPESPELVPLFEAANHMRWAIQLTNFPFGSFGSE